MKKALLVCVLSLEANLLIALVCASTLAARPRLEVPPFPAKLDLSSVEKLYKSEAYSVGVRQVGKSKFMPCFVFETKNDWVWFDFFNRTKGADLMSTIGPHNWAREEVGTISFSDAGLQLLT